MNNRHTMSLRGLIDDEYLPTDDWKAIEFDGLDDLDFELSNVYSMIFDFEEEYGGDKKKIFIEVKKKKGGNWVVKLSKKNEGKKIITKEFDEYTKMLNFIHAVFNKL